MAKKQTDSSEVKDVLTKGLISFGRLEVVAVDKSKCRVFIAVNEPDHALRVELLQTEDAKRLAMRQAQQEGWREATLKDHTILFHKASQYHKDLKDDETYLVVDIYTPAMYEFTPFGDSLEN